MARTYFLAAAGLFLGLIAVAAAMKYVEVRRSAHWPSTRGRIRSCKVVEHRSSLDNEIRNKIEIRYDFTVDGRRYEGTRIGQNEGEKTGQTPVVGWLERYPPGTEVTVYYDPVQPTNAILEREVASDILGLAAILLGVVAAVSLGLIFGVERLMDVAATHIGQHGRAAFTVLLSLVALLLALAIFGTWRQIADTAKWHKTAGRIETSAPEAYRTGHDDIGGASTPAHGNRFGRNYYRPDIVYSFVVDGQTFHGNRIGYGGKFASTMESLARHKTDRYPPGAAVTVYYDPANPSDAVIERSFQLFWVLTVILACLILAAAWVSGLVFEGPPPTLR